MHSATNGRQDSNSQATALTGGGNYQSPTKPFAKRLFASGEGITTKQRDLEIAKLQNIANQWQVLGKRFEVERAKHNAHQKQFEAMGAGVQASTALVNSSTSWNKYQGAIASNRISKSEARTAIQSISVEVERHNVELEKKKASLDKAKLDLEQSLTANAQQRLSIETDKELAYIVGNPVEVSLPTFMQNLSGLLQPVGEIQFHD